MEEKKIRSTPCASPDTGRRRHSRSGRTVGLHAARTGGRRLAAACATKSRGEERRGPATAIRRAAWPCWRPAPAATRPRKVWEGAAASALGWRAARVAPRGERRGGRRCGTTEQNHETVCMSYDKTRPNILMPLHFRVEKKHCDAPSTTKGASKLYAKTPDGTEPTHRQRHRDTYTISSKRAHQ
ncbi:hypothetical protein BDA96_09G073300 [Sorghum bicolor]|uniref:Uncharacterized protein n=2 Tax=Sorghum bicolor TaxID=4558 RepID=A0A921U442_SORBI|nr:hypothetical protein BDA96_09G073300 [Sorghum bicolor]OQU77569.1 hypothetical protein SORBI_3009G069450 [Sorghum bicolor]